MGKILDKLIYGYFDFKAKKLEKRAEHCTLTDEEIEQATTEVWERIQEEIKKARA